MRRKQRRGPVGSVEVPLDHRHQPKHPGRDHDRHRREEAPNTRPREHRTHCTATGGQVEAGDPSRFVQNREESTLETPRRRRAPPARQHHAPRVVLSTSKEACEVPRRPALEPSSLTRPTNTNASEDTRLGIATSTSRGRVEADAAKPSRIEAFLFAGGACHDLPRGLCRSWSDRPSRARGSAAHVRSRGLLLGLFPKAVHVRFDDVRVERLEPGVFFGRHHGTDLLLPVGSSDETLALLCVARRSRQPHTHPSIAAFDPPSCFLTSVSASLIFFVVRTGGPVATVVAFLGVSFSPSGPPLSPRSHAVLPPGRTSLHGHDHGSCFFVSDDHLGQLVQERIGIQPHHPPSFLHTSFSSCSDERARKGVAKVPLPTRKCRRHRRPSDTPFGPPAPSHRYLPSNRSNEHPFVSIPLPIDTSPEKGEERTRFAIDIVSEGIEIFGEGRKGPSRRTPESRSIFARRRARARVCRRHERAETPPGTLSPESAVEGASTRWRREERKEDGSGS
eukprot:scaffold5_cov331-Pavlova_lutheri.AAC.6